MAVNTMYEVTTVVCDMSGPTLEIKCLDCCRSSSVSDHCLGISGVDWLLVSEAVCLLLELVRIEQQVTI